MLFNCSVDSSSDSQEKPSDSSQVIRPDNMYSSFRLILLHIYNNTTQAQVLWTEDEPDLSDAPAYVCYNMHARTYDIVI